MHEDSSEEPVALDYAAKADRRPPFWSRELLTLLLVVAGVALVVSLMLPSRPLRRKPSLESICEYHLWGVGAGLLAYAAENNGQLPPKLKTLITWDVLAPSDLLCPKAGDEGRTVFYLYMPWPTTEGLTPQNVLAYEPADTHGGGPVNVVFADGHTERLTVPAFEAALAASEARRQKLSSDGR